MSILLDALKKSEEQRQLGKAPTIHSPASDASRDSEGGTQWVPLGMMTLAAVAMAWIGWQQFRPPPDGGASPDPEVAALESGDAPPGLEGQAASAAADETGTAAAESSEATAAVRRPQAIAGAGRRTPVESFKPDPRAAKVASVASPAEPTPAPAPAVQNPAPAESPQVASDADQGNGAAVETAQSEPATRAAQPHVPEPISYWELPQNVRDELPDLRLSVLVYAERPADRFVLINGQRFLENEAVDSGVVLEEVRRNGVVFRYRSYRFLLEG